ncbi:hypothetical protein GUJ93_ZPchr0007g5075 [Zizania palustris]|uniref:Uncharacterized protein n=1 Tax=Zizania palustris TaxID=103762 RepID=A0A8J5T7S5_ZIZPA|nr:hypothetical protein GUJ93_ZPchr0007g5075 [Zizania palustris]
MEAAAEAFPIGFTRGIRSYWRSRKYQRVDGGAAAGRTRRQVRLGDGGGGGGGGAWAVRLGGMFRARVKAAPATTATAVAKVPARVLGRIRDAYVDVMLGVAKKSSAAALSVQGGTTEALWQKRVPVRRSRGQRQVRQKAEELGQRLVMEMYKSVLASRDLSGMLQASRAR